MKVYTNLALNYFCVIHTKHCKLWNLWTVKAVYDAWILCSPWLQASHFTVTRGILIEKNTFGVILHSNFNFHWQCFFTLFFVLFYTDFCLYPLCPFYSVPQLQQYTLILVLGVCIHFLACVKNSFLKASRRGKPKCADVPRDFLKI